MNVVDPPDKLVDLRWETPSETGSDAGLLSACDRTVSAAALARDKLAGVLRNVDRTSGDQQTRSSLQTAGRAASTAVRLAESCNHLLEQNQATLGPELVSRGKEVLAALISSGVDKISSLVPRDSSNPPPLDRDSLDRLEKSRQQLVQAVRTIGQLADRIGHRLSESKGGTPPRRGAEILTRREKVDHLLRPAQQPG